MSAPAFEPNTPGIYQIPANVYHSAPGVSNSMLGHMDPPARLPAYLQNRPAPSLAMRLGTLIHQRILEPDRPLTGLAFQPDDLSLATKEGRAWKAAQSSAGLEIIGPKTWQKLIGCVDAIRNHAGCRQIFQRGQAELSLFCGIAGVLAKARVDWLPEQSNAIVDVKKVPEGKGGHEAFTRLLIERRYHVQAAYYLDLWNMLAESRDCFVFVVVEDEPPYLVSRYVVGGELIELGRQQYLRDLAIYQRCEASGKWPGYDDQVATLLRPSWMRI